MVETKGMKKAAFLAIVGMGAAGTAPAAPDLRVDPGTYQYGNGGLFQLTIFGTITNGAATESVQPGVIQTFCVEGNEFISWGGRYYAQLNTFAIGGGLGGPSPDPLGPEAAWLYAQYLDNLFPTSLTVDSTTDAGKLQDAIRHFEQEVYDPYNPYVQYANANCDWTTTGDIRVLNRRKTLGYDSRTS
jgi:hypothetical protein